jgi:hypothetical protein
MVIRQQDDCSRDTQLLSQISGGRKALAWANGSTEGCLTYPAVNLSKERLPLTGDWYRQLHKKWLFQNTSGGVNLDVQRDSASNARLHFHRGTECAWLF